MDIIQLEILPLPEEEKEPGISEEDSSSSSSEDERGSPLQIPVSPVGDRDRADKQRQETVDMILDCIMPPERFERGGKKYLRRLSRQPVTRNELIDLSKKFENYLKERQVRMEGYCEIRRELYELLFDELIRQSTIFCPDRGSLLLRVRDELRMTMSVYQKLSDSGIEYGTRKALEAEMATASLTLKVSQLKEEKRVAEKRIRDLQAEMEAEETLSRQRVDVKQLRHEERMEFLRKANKQLKEQLSMINTAT